MWLFNSLNPTHLNVPFLLGCLFISLLVCFSPLSVEVKISLVIWTTQILLYRYLVISYSDSFEFKISFQFSAKLTIINARLTQVELLEILIMFINRYPKFHENACPLFFFPFLNQKTKLFIFPVKFHDQIQKILYGCNKIYMVPIPHQKSRKHCVRVQWRNEIIPHSMKW